MNRNFLEYTSSILFWKYYREEESYERDLKIYFAYKGLDISNFLLGGAIFGIGLLVSYLFTVLFGIQFIDGVGPVLLQVNLWIGIGISLANYLIQRSVGKKVYQRIWEQRWEARVDKIINWFKVCLHEALREALSENESVERENPEHQNEYRSYFEEKINQDNSEETEIHRILKRFNLPSDTSDMQLIKKEYRKLAKKYHPDMPTGNEDIFKQIVLDFETLKYCFDVKKAG